jgi:transcriptional regulator with GAF, ATPase, and Fis domain
MRQHKGKFEQAHGGTLFLDEVGDMSLAAQAKVLRALQEQKVSRVGGDKAIPVDVRVVSATNKNLVEEIAAGRFREDLYHRLSVIVIHVPPLKERLDDIPLLVNYFVDKICREYDIDNKEIEPAAIEMLQQHIWTGNIRELRNVVERLIVLGGDTITASDVQKYAPPASMK